MQGDGSVFIVDNLLSDENGKPHRGAWQIYTEATATVQGSVATLSLNGVMAQAEIMAPVGLAWSLAPALSPEGQSSNASFKKLSFEIPILAGQTEVVVRISTAGSHSTSSPPLSIGDWPLQR